MTTVYDPPYIEDAPGSEVSARLSTAETAECTCPEFCERDHDVD